MLSTKLKSVDENIEIHFILNMKFRVQIFTDNNNNIEMSTTGLQYKNIELRY